MLIKKIKSSTDLNKIYSLTFDEKGNKLDKDINESEENNNN